MHTLESMPQQKRPANQGEGALFDFEDLQALRDEYEERLARVERERVATVDVLKKDNDNRIASMQRDYEQRLQNEASSRQDLIHELTFELAAAREDGERRAQEADKRRLVVEQQLESALAEIGRIESDVQRLKDTLTRALVVRAPAPAAVPVSASLSSPPRTPPPVPADEGGPSASLAVYAPMKKKKIRLR